MIPTLGPLHGPICTESCSMQGLNSCGYGYEGYRLETYSGSDELSVLWDIFTGFTPLDKTQCKFFGLHALCCSSTAGLPPEHLSKDQRSKVTAPVRFREPYLLCDGLFSWPSDRARAAAGPQTVAHWLLLRKKKKPSSINWLQFINLTKTKCEKILTNPDNFKAARDTGV